MTKIKGRREREKTFIFVRAWGGLDPYGELGP